MSGAVKQYSKEFREQILKEVQDTGNMALVAKTHGIVYQTVSSWVRLARKAPERERKKSHSKLEARLRDAELENRILKELLKKTNQLWLSEEPSAGSSSAKGTGSQK